MLKKTKENGVFDCLKVLKLFYFLTFEAMTFKYVIKITM